MISWPAPRRGRPSWSSEFAVTARSWVGSSTPSRPESLASIPARVSHRYIDAEEQLPCRKEERELERGWDQVVEVEEQQQLNTDQQDDEQNPTRADVAGCRISKSHLLSPRILELHSTGC